MEDLRLLAARVVGRVTPEQIASLADVLDERRAASLRRGGRSDHPAPPYPQRTFTDEDAARSWARAALLASAPGAVAR